MQETHDSFTIRVTPLERAKLEILARFHKVPVESLILFAIYRYVERASS
jgi:hypothetical protein